MDRGRTRRTLWVCVANNLDFWEGVSIGDGDDSSSLDENIKEVKSTMFKITIKINLIDGVGSKNDCS